MVGTTEEEEEVNASSVTESIEQEEVVEREPFPFF